MLDSPTDRISDLSVRDGQLSAVTCAACGCRLAVSERDEAWYHFEGATGRDARGCRVGCVGAAHDRHGRVSTGA